MVSRRKIRSGHVRWEETGFVTAVFTFSELKKKKHAKFFQYVYMRIYAHNRFDFAISGKKKKNPVH